MTGNDSRHGDLHRSILVVHGRDFKPDRQALFELVGEALRAGIERDYPDCVADFESTRLALAYYGDLTNALLEEQGETYDQALDLGDRNNALRALMEIKARKRFGIRQYDRLPGKSAVPEFLADIGAPLLGSLGLTMPAVKWLSKDFHAYLTGLTHYAARLRERVRAELCARLDAGERVLLMAHGTGSVVAYDVLWQLSHDERFAGTYAQKKIDTLVTLGSPLGDLFIRRRLLAARDATRPNFPANVVNWHNVAAEDDYTCHDITIADDFRKMLNDRLVSAVHDYRVYNLAVRFGRSNPHSSIGYYIHPRVSKILVDWIRTGTVGGQR